MADKSSNSYSNAQLEAMLKSTAKRLGTTPEALKQAAENGDFSNLTGNSNTAEAQAMRKVLSDPQAAQKLLQSPQAQALLKLFGQGK